MPMPFYTMSFKVVVLAVTVAAIVILLSIREKPKARGCHPLRASDGMTTKIYQALSAGA
ncbi:hypothetical protein [Selenomonas sp. KH1T6]|uniref:hypothetical protein n=1 Tax=Selenomonas sp. KH1T6 TaxID=3158784 RepID=UPI0015874487